MTKYTKGVAEEAEESARTSSYRNKSSHGGSMASSILRFEDINFVVGKGDKARNILEDVSGKVKYGHVLAVLGPSGAGKTTLISALTLDAFYGKPTGSVTLNGVPLTDSLFKRHCYVVKQHDKHWPFLTARETLQYAAELYDVAEKQYIGIVVDEMISKMGLDSCADTRAARLSGGQKRRLSLAIALLKQPTLLFLDEPTSGLDAAAASNIMREIIRVARDERLIILCTIHQPSTKVYNGFDQLMILSKGREAFAGMVKDAGPYFSSIGHPVPPATNPAEHYLDLVNSDFSSNEEVDYILDTWQNSKSVGSVHGRRQCDLDVSTGVEKTARRSLAREIPIMFRRHVTLIFRDPVLYLGRCVIFLAANMVFGFVYWSARANTQDQAVNKLWVSLWYIAVPANMGVVAVYALNDEFKSIMRETKNGMVTSISYILAKTVLVIPMMGVFSLFALGIPGYAIQTFEPSSFPVVIGIYACVIYVFECAAECFAVLFEDPILGMLQFMNLWFASFLFGGFLIPLRDLYWPFKAFHYVLPFGYYLRSTIYTIFIDADWAACTDPTTSSVCVPSTDGKDVLDGLSVIFPVVESENRVGKDLLIVLAIAVFFKLVTIVIIIVRTKRVAPIGSPGGRSMASSRNITAPAPSTRVINNSEESATATAPETSPPTIADGDDEELEVEC